MNYVTELLFDLSKRIALEEAAVRERIKRVAYGADPADVEDEIREEWHKFHLATKPLQDQQQELIKHLVQIEACKPPAPVVVPAGSYARSLRKLR